MTTRSVAFRLTPPQRTALDELLAFEQTTQPELSLERYVYQVWRPLAAQWAHTLHTLELRGKLGPTFPENPRDPSGPKKTVEFTAADVPWGDYTAPEPTDEDRADPAALVVRFPEKVLANLERGVALESTFNSCYPAEMNQKVWDSFEDWSTAALVDAIMREYAKPKGLDATAVAAEEEELYPGITKPVPLKAEAKAPVAPTPRELVQAARDRRLHKSTL